MINKKVFALTLVASSVIAAGCSSDDDDDDDMTGDNTMEPGTMEPGTMEPGGTTNPETPAFEYPVYDTEGNSVADVIANDPRLSVLFGALQNAGLLDQLDYTQEKADALMAEGSADTDEGDDIGDELEEAGDEIEEEVTGDEDDADADMEIPPVVNYTVFAPNDDAFAAADLAALSQDQVTSALLGHVVQGTVTVEEIGANSADNDGAGGDPFTTLGGTTIQLSTNESGGPVVNGTTNFAGAGTDEEGNEIGGTIEADNGIVHVIDMVLMGDGTGTTEPGEGGEPTTPPAGGEEGAAIGALRGAGSNGFADIYGATNFGGALDDNAWTVFVPTDTALDSGTAASIAADNAQATTVVQQHVLTEGAFGPDELPATATTNGGVSLNIVSNDDGITVNGFDATPVDVDGSNAAIYQIEGLLQ